ncbi:MAG: type I-C CRISPR-associated protein Cas7/Csd2 [Anaerolineaceae bacterium]
MNTPINNRYEFVLLYDVENGNPNGDPDAGNMPRIDPETGYGIVTDVCLKRKIRNYVELVKQDSSGYKIYVKEGIPLNTQHKQAYLANGIDVPDKDKAKNVSNETINTVRAWMCANFYDVRTFGAVMTTGVNCGQVRGPVQLNFSKSLDPIVQQEVTITRVTVTQEEAEKKTEMGRKHIVPYGLYRMEGYVSAKLANQAGKGTGFSEEDLELLWDALANMFEHDHSASHGAMATRKLVIFKHESELGNAPAHQLFDLVQVERVNGDNPPRSFADYEVTISKDRLPEGVTLIERV